MWITWRSHSLLNQWRELSTILTGKSLLLCGRGCLESLKVPAFFLFSFLWKSDDCVFEDFSLVNYIIPTFLYFFLPSPLSSSSIPFFLPHFFFLFLLFLSLLRHLCRVDQPTVPPHTGVCRCHERALHRCLRKVLYTEAAPVNVNISSNGGKDHVFC